MPVASDEYKDRLFTFIFGGEEHKDWTLQLYNAISGTRHEDPAKVTIYTIREALYLGMHNDVSFLLGSEVSLYEQQSTRNPNMPLRMLQYVGSLYERYVREHRLNKYGAKRLCLPAPRLVVFYNGIRAAPEEETLLLSSSFPEGTTGDVEVRVRVLNVNPGMGERAKEACAPLREYCWLVEEIRRLVPELGTDRAVDRALESMPHNFVVRSYLLAHKAEVKDMLLTEYNEAEAMELFREEGREEGREEATVSHLRNLMRSLGLTARQAMDALGVPEAKRAGYLTML